MVVIWGLDLKEMQWGKFKNSYMWSNTYHKRRTKFGVYQLAMIFCVVSESLGTDAISKYNEERSRITDATGNQEHFSSGDLNGAFSYNIFVGIYVATIFGAAFFFDLFWPERQESAAVRLAWKICSVLTIVFSLSSAILLSVIIATHRAFLGGGFEVPQIDPPLQYKRNGEAIASLVLLWIGFLATIWSTYLMWTCTDYIHKNGPFSSHAKKDLEGKGYGEIAEKPPGSTNPGDKALHGDVTAGQEAGFNMHERSTVTTASSNPHAPSTPLPQEAIAYMRANPEPVYASPTA